MITSVQNDNTPLTVTVDFREKNNRLLGMLNKSKDVSVEKGHLKVGDYRINQLLVERKTIPDLASSIKDGRLFMQASKLKKSGSPGLFLIEGTVRDLSKTGMKRQAIQGAIISIVLKFELPLLRSISPEESALLMIYAARQIYFPTDSKWVKNNSVRSRIHNKPKKVVRPFWDKFRDQMNVLHGIPGVGSKKAMLLLKKFGSIANLTEATKEEIKSIPGIGNNNAETIFKTLHSDFSGET
jgi:DNA excision repair protein ERCC-4